MIFPFPHKLERWLGELWFEDLREKVEPNVLPPLHSDSVRVRRIASQIVRAAIDLGLADRRGHEKVSIMLGASPRRDEAERPSRRGEGLGAKPQTGSLLDGWEVIVVKDDRIKARCVPCGKMLVYTGLLDKLGEDAEIATVLGHEIGHAVARHGVKRIIMTKLCCVLRIITFSLYQGQPLLASLCRKQEKEADHIGLMLLAAAGYDPRPTPLFYEKLGKIVGNKYSSSVHPPCTERAQLLRQPNLMKEAMELYRRVEANKYVAAKIISRS